MILPVGGNEGKAWTQMPMELWYLTTTMNALPRTMREPIVRRWDTIGYNMKLQMLLHRREVVMKNKTKRALSALVSSRSLGEQTAVESQINCLYLTSWCRNHNTVLGSKSCIRRTQCHQDALWQYGFFVCLLLYSTKWAPRLTFRWWIGRMILYIKFACNNLIAKSAFSC